MARLINGCKNVSIAAVLLAATIVCCSGCASTPYPPPKVRFVPDQNPLTSSNAQASGAVVHLSPDPYATQQAPGANSKWEIHFTFSAEGDVVAATEVLGESRQELSVRAANANDWPEDHINTLMYVLSRPDGPDPGWVYYVGRTAAHIFGVPTAFLQWRETSGRQATRWYWEVR